MGDNEKLGDTFLSITIFVSIQFISIAPIHRSGHHKALYKTFFFIAPFFSNTPHVYHPTLCKILKELKLKKQEALGMLA